MNEGWLLLGFLLLCLFALFLIVYPFRKSPILCVILGLIVLVAFGLGYCQWGNWPTWSVYSKETRRQQRALAILKSVSGPEELIQRLKSKVGEHPEKAQGWYLLGRLYASQNQWDNAIAAFRKAYQIEPKNI